MPSFKLTYFNIRARAEVSRLALAAAGQKFEDIRLTQEEWDKQKEKTPFGQLPLLEVDGKTLQQSNAIARYLAREYGLYGSTNMQRTEVDMIIDSVEEALTTGIKVVFEKDETKKREIIENLSKTLLPKLFKYLDAMLRQYKTGWLVGSELTIADLAVFNVMEFLKDSAFKEKTIEEVLKGQDGLLSHRKKVMECDKVRGYLAKRPKTAL